MGRHSAPMNTCGCASCADGTFSRMHLCESCGNKRCPKATHHAHVCTGSNEPGQLGSNYGVTARYPLSPADEAFAQDMRRQLAEIRGGA